jgi:hypothetical protein
MRKGRLGRDQVHSSKKTDCQRKGTRDNGIFSFPDGAAPQGLQGIRNPLAESLQQSGIFQKPDSICGKSFTSGLTFTEGVRDISNLLADTSPPAYKSRSRLLAIH